jgi:8-oxo-dGTP diphosphatase
MDEHYNDAIAIEMESAGVAQAGHLNDNVPVVVVRGISDRADGTKETTDRAQWQPKAVASAAAFAEALADEFVRHVHKNRREEAKAVAKVERKGPSAVNQKVSRSNEVIQVGIIHGNANIGGMSHRQAPTLSATDQLGNLGERLTQARVFGELDPETVAAAEAELAVAADALVGRSPNAAPMMALKRLRGLVEDVPDLASRVAAVISTVSGRS